MDSILNQSHQDFEIIILDDCSTDESLNVINSYLSSKISHIIINQQNSGSTFKQWKKGIEKAKGDYIWIAESDDYCSNNFLETAMRTFKTDSTISLFYSKSERVDENGKFVDKLEWWFDDLGLSKWLRSHTSNCSEEIYKFLSKKNTIVNASAVVFKNKTWVLEILDKVVDYKFCGDWMFWLIYLKNAEKLFYSTDATNYFRIHSKTTRQNVDYKRNFEILKIFNWLIKNGYNGGDEARKFKYFFEHHIIKPPRRYLITNIRLLIKSLSFSKFYSLNIIHYYLKIIN